MSKPRSNKVRTVVLQRRYWVAPERPVSSTSWKAFLNVGEALAARWIEMPRGILLLQSVPDQPASGAIYLYDRERRIFISCPSLTVGTMTLTLPN